jgi:hypothetical protein
MRFFRHDANAARRVDAGMLDLERAFAGLQIDVLSVGAAPVNVSRLNIVPVGKHDALARQLIGHALNDPRRRDSFEDLALARGRRLREGIGGRQNHRECRRARATEGGNFASSIRERTIHCLGHPRWTSDFERKRSSAYSRRRF